MASLEQFDFPGFVRERASRHPGAVQGDDHGYAYISDRNTRATFERLKPVELAVAAAVRTFKNVGKAELLGHAVKIGPRQFPRVHALAERCAETLGIPVPTVYVVSNPHLNAATYGTNEDAFILVNSALMDHFSDAELLSVIGQECGHIHNNHVVYLTALHYLSNVAGRTFEVSTFALDASVVAALALGIGTLFANAAVGGLFLLAAPTLASPVLSPRRARSSVKASVSARSGHGPPRPR